MKPPQIGLIGHGSWGKNHARVLRSLGALRWVYDADPAMLVDCPERTSFIEKVWEDQKVQGVVIATPPAAHFDLTCTALAAGKHVLVEKPMTTTMSDAVKLMRGAEMTSRILMVGHLMRYHDGFRALLSTMGNVGRLEYLYSHRLQPGRVRSDVSSLWSLATHDISMMIAVAGMPLTVSCSAGTTRTPGLADIVTATLEFAEGVRGHLFVSWLHATKQREFCLIGDRGAIAMDERFTLEPLRRELEHFLDCIITGIACATGADDGIAVVRVLEACQESMNRGGVLWKV